MNVYDIIGQVHDKTFLENFHCQNCTYHIEEENILPYGDGTAPEPLRSCDADQSYECPGVRMFVREIATYAAEYRI